MTDNKWLGWDDLTTEARDTYEQRWIEYFMNETEISRSNLEPLFESQLDLHFWKEEDNAEIIFKPSMFASTGLCAIVKELMQNIFAQGSLISRVATHLKKENYKVFNFFEKYFKTPYLVPANIFSQNFGRDIPS